MSEPNLTCRDDRRRRHRVRQTSGNGLDYLEVSDDQRTLEVYFLGKAPAKGSIRKENFRIDGGRRIRDIAVTDLTVHRQKDPELDDRAELRVDRLGDFSTYTLRVVATDEDGRPTGEPMPGFDPRYDRLDFSFKVECASELDCKPRDVCPPETWPAPEINYLAKDYQSFRQLLLDRLAVTLPEWRERHVPDLGIALVETLAYAADHLSYYQDAVATEAYLDTARQRISVRRHARLVDYAMHEGVNARAWVTLAVDAPRLVLPPQGSPPGGFYLITGYDGVPAAGTVLTEDQLPTEPPLPYEVFEPFVDEIELFKAHNEIAFYTWGERQCCLPRGATRATLADPGAVPENDDPYAEQKGGKGRRARKQQKKKPVDDEPPPPVHALLLAPGDVLIFEEVKGPETGVEADADPGHRHAVRLTRVDQGVDPLTGRLIVEVEWHEKDALPFPLCISAVGRAPECELIADVSVARGNVLLVDHGRRIADEDLDPVPECRRRWRCEDECRPVELEPDCPRYRPRLDRGPLVFARPYDPGGPACAALDQDPRRALPWIELAFGRKAADGSFTAESGWRPRRDLLASGPSDRHFVVEVDNDRRGRLRFGDGELGRLPPGGSAARATYRIADGPRGNVGAETISHVVLRAAKLSGETVTARNPLPARGGTAPEPMADVKRLAPHAFRSELERAITADDYARLAEEHPGVQRAAARLRFTGCSTKVLVAVDPLGRAEADAELLRQVAEHLHPYRRMGHEVVVARAQYVPLRIELTVCVEADYLQGHVLAALLDRLSNRTLADGRRGFFHPDELTFGQGVYLSELVAAVQAVPGVESVPIDPAHTRFQRYGEGPDDEIENGVLPLGPLEIARLDNDPSCEENGVLKLDLRGGR